MLYRTRIREIFFALVLCLLLSSLTIAQPNKSDKPAGPAGKSADDPIALNNAAVRLSSESRYEEAADALVRAINAAPAQSKFHRNLSFVYQRMNRMDDAIAEAATSVDLAPREPVALDQLCSLKVLKGRHAEAVICFENLIDIAPLSDDSQTLYGIALLRSGETSKAVSALQRAVASAPSHVPTINALGIVYFNLKQYSEAVHSFKRAVDLDPHHGELRFNLALAQTANRNKEAGISQYRILKEEHPKLAEELYQLLFQNNVVHVDALKRR